jgi:hypothetical protein
MAIDLSTIMFTTWADVVPPFGVEEIVNTGIANTLAGNDSITGNASNIDSGDGILNGNDDNRTASIDTGDGDDIISGTGNNSDYGFGILNRGSIYTGNGNDLITGIGGGGIINDNRIDTSNGNDIIIGIGPRAILNFGYISTGSGNDFIIAYGNITNTNSMDLGDGNDSIIVTGNISNIGNIFTGNGNDSIITYGSLNRDGYGSFVELEDGNDYFKGFGDGRYGGGNGQDTLELPPGNYTIEKWFTTVTFTEDSTFTSPSQKARMNTLNFEKLIVGHTIYDFTSLTNGQTISVA